MVFRLVVLLSLFVIACGGDDESNRYYQMLHHDPNTPTNCKNPGTPAATASCQSRPKRRNTTWLRLKPILTPSMSIIETVFPSYHPLVARWEWPPWLLLTGYTGEDMIGTSDLYALRTVHGPQERLSFL